MNKILGAIGKFAKGKATVIGSVLGGLGLVGGGSDAVSDCTAKLLSSPDSAAATAGIILAIFGVARKAGWVGGAASK